MRKNTLKKAMAVMISATMLVTGYTAVSYTHLDVYKRQDL